MMRAREICCICCIYMISIVSDRQRAVSVAGPPALL